ncbi:MAG: hypoxanthine phosphoribosyltransferase [candidate division WS6 bacterium 34_10]|uniref:Hypoxanthine phosphoribosyltransferase n=1 Tax=candidate division WS6 bacterium 34_10 TaxID=1641389 RepID=A0A117LZX4_9BACT|nr:MAG: hypoxanthine phosphoribosyltransferase [candidate division WS6 bacterium 34_10]
MIENNSENEAVYEVLLTEDQISERIYELGDEIIEDYQNNDRALILVGVLNGAYMFTSDLSKRLEPLNPYVDFIGLSSYPEGERPSQLPVLRLDTKIDINGADVIIVEDIVDTGHSIHEAKELLNRKNPNSIKVCSLLSKPSRREIEVEIDYLGFEIPNYWVVGFGLDEDEQFRFNERIYRKIVK